MSSPFAIQLYQLARRSVVRTLRQPFQIVPSLSFPLLLLAINSSGLDAATEIPGFPTDSYVDFALAFAFMQGTVFAVTNAGTDLARDVQTGFLSRLSLTPMKGAALLAGQLAGSVLLGLFQAVCFISVGLIAGADIKSGVTGALVLVALTVTTALAFASVGAFAALRTGSGEAVQGLFPLFFVFLFLSSISLPRNLIEIDWFRTVATINPVSYMVEGMRSLIITGWDGQALALAFAFSGALLLVGLTASSAALRGRLERT